MTEDSEVKDILETLEEAERAGVEVELDVVLKLPPVDRRTVTLEIGKIKKATAPQFIIPDD